MRSKLPWSWMLPVILLMCVSCFGLIAGDSLALGETEEHGVAKKVWDQAGDAGRDIAVRLMYERIEAGTGDKVTGHGTAFGVFLESSTGLLTAAHNVLDERGEAYKVLRCELNGKWRDVKVVRLEKKFDLALLDFPRSPDLLNVRATFLLPDDPAQGERVIFRASPEGAPIAPHAGIVREQNVDGTVRTLVQIDFHHGESGGPLLIHGDVCGMAVCGLSKNGELDTTQGMFVPASIIRKFLAEK